MRANSLRLSSLPRTATTSTATVTVAPAGGIRAIARTAAPHQKIFHQHHHLTFCHFFNSIANCRHASSSSSSSSSSTASSSQGEERVYTEDWVLALTKPIEGHSLHAEGTEFVASTIVRPLLKLLQQKKSSDAVQWTRSWVSLALHFEELGTRFDEQTLGSPLSEHWAALANSVSSPPSAEVRALATVCQAMYLFYTKQDMMNAFVYFNKAIILNQDYEKRAKLKVQAPGEGQYEQQKMEIPEKPEEPVKRKRGRPKKAETIAREEAERKKNEEEEEKESEQAASAKQDIEKKETMTENDENDISEPQEEGKELRFDAPIKADLSKVPLTQEERSAMRLLRNYMFNAFYHRATLYSNQLQQDMLAVQDFERSTELQPNFINTYLNSGVAYLQLMNNPFKAIEQFTYVLENLDSDNLMALMNRATVFFKQGQYDAAFKDYSKICQLDPNNTIAWFSCGRIKGMSEPASAKDYYDKCIALNPHFATPYYDRAVLYLTVFDDPLSALEDFKKAIEISPEMALAHLDMGVIYLNRFENPTKSLECLNRAIELDTNLAQAYHLRGTIYHRYQQNTDLALEDYSAAIQLDDKEAEFYSSRASLFYEQLNNPKEALQDYNRAIELDPNCSAYYSNRGVVKVFKMGEALEGLKDFISAVNLNPRDSMSYYNMGSVYHVNLNKPQRALECYNKAAEVDPDNAQVFEARGYLFRDVIKNPAAASLDFERVNMLKQRAQRKEELKKTRLNVD